MKIKHRYKYIALTTCILATSYVYADIHIDAEITPEQIALIDQLKGCAENAFSQGINTLETIVSHCSQEKSNVDTAFSESMSEYVINSVLGT